MLAMKRVLYRGSISMNSRPTGSNAETDGEPVCKSVGHHRCRVLISKLVLYGRKCRNNVLSDMNELK